MTQIVSSIDAVTPEWLTGVFHEAGVLPRASRVVALRNTQIGQGVGVMGEIQRVELDVEGDRGMTPASVVVKLPSAFEANRAQGIGLGMYEAEVRFYRELAPSTPSGLPTIYFSDIVSGTADFVIVMEDLGRLTLVDQPTGMTVDQAAAALRVLAGVHAAWWGKVQTPALDWIPTMNGPRIQMVDGALQQLWPVFAGLFGDILPEGGAALGERFSQNYLHLQQGFVSSPWTLAHQDYRVDNMMFGDPAIDEVVIIDWQGIGRGPGGYDVAYILGGSLPIEARREHERALVGEYHSRLAAAGVDYSADAVWNDYRYAHALGGLATSVFVGAGLDLSNERGKALVTSMSQRHFTAALDHGCEALLP
jgi:Ecdysteroid kinase-like family